jgi:Icc protein
MTSKPVFIAQISDLHIKPAGSLAYVAALNEFRPRPNLVVISGDPADTPTAEEYRHLQRLLEPLRHLSSASPAITISAK